MSDGLLDLDFVRSAVLQGRERAKADAGYRALTVRIKAGVVHNTQLEAHAGRFRLLSDEHGQNGGAEAGPTPLHFFLAGVAF